MVTFEEIAQYAFMAFVVIATIAGLAIGYMAWSEDVAYPDGFAAVEETKAYVTLIMLILGIIVGLMSITAKEVTPFLIAAIALAVIRREVWEPLGIISGGLLPYLATAIVDFIVAFVAPAAVIIAIKAVYALARKK
jgi:Na+/H+ antiporter NhaC